MRDKDIRDELLKNHLSPIKVDHTAKLVNELAVCEGNAKIDVAVINGALWGYEIKSERDTLNRLPNQVDQYNKVFDYLNIVVSKKHLKDVRSIIPGFWGIMCVKQLDGDIKLECVRLPKRNKRTDALSISQLLWKEEAMSILKKKDLSKGMSTKKRPELWKELSSNLEKEDLAYEVREALKSRTNWK